MFFLFKNRNETNFWNDFLENYSKLIYFNIRKTFDYYNFKYQQNDIDDCYNEIFIKIMESKETIYNNYNNEKSKFSTYLSTICFNKIVDFLNKEKHKYNFKNNEDSVYIDEDLDIKLEIEKILQISELSERELLIIKMYYFKELSSKEISEILNVKETTVRVTKKKALDKIKRNYNEN